MRGHSQGVHKTTEDTPWILPMQLLILDLSLWSAPYHFAIECSNNFQKRQYPQLSVEVRQFYLQLIYDSKKKASYYRAHCLFNNSVRLFSEVLASHIVERRNIINVDKCNSRYELLCFQNVLQRHWQYHFYGVHQRTSRAVLTF